MANKDSGYLEEFGKILFNIVECIIKEKVSIPLTIEPKMALKTIHEYDSRMRVSALEKFNDAGYISYVNFYRSEGDKQKQNTIGALVFYVKEFEIEATMKILGVKVDEEVQEDVCKNLSEFFKTLTAEFKKAIVAVGYPNLVSSEPASFRNNVPKGVLFSFDQYDKYEVIIPIKGQVLYAMDITLTRLK